MADYPNELDTRPLTTWPGELTKNRVRAPFTAPLRSTLRQLTTELGMLKARHPVLELAIPSDQWRIDGRPRANALALHPGIVLSLPTTSVGPLRYACDRFWTWQDNLRAVTLGLEALRKVERYGITRRGEQYQGFKALPAGSGGESSHLTYEEALASLVQIAGMPVYDSHRELTRAAKAAAHPDRNEGRRELWDLVEAAVGVLDRADRTVAL